MTDKSKIEEKKKCVIYRRSTIKSRNDDMDVQKLICGIHAYRRGYEITGIFTDIAQGTARKRPGLHDLISFLKVSRHRKIRVFVANASRISSDICTFTELKREIELAGGVLESADISQDKHADFLHSCIHFTPVTASADPIEAKPGTPETKPERNHEEE